MKPAASRFTGFPVLVGTPCDSSRDRGHLYIRPWARIRSFLSAVRDMNVVLQLMITVKPFLKVDIVFSIVDIMVPLLDGKSEIGAHVRRDLCNSICLRHFIRSRVVIMGIFLKSTIILHACATCSKLPSINISTMHHAVMQCQYMYLNE